MEEQNPNQKGRERNLDAKGKGIIIEEEMH
jgi:hypothetical protein